MPTARVYIVPGINWTARCASDRGTYNLDLFESMSLKWNLDCDNEVLQVLSNTWATVPIVKLHRYLNDYSRIYNRCQDDTFAAEMKYERIGVE